MAESPDENLRQKLEFILNGNVELVAASRDEILELIERGCGNAARKSQAAPQPALQSDGMVTPMLLSVNEVARVDAEMSELHLQCPECGHRERVNDIGKIMLKQGRNVFAKYNCPGCKHVYDGAARLFAGTTPANVLTPPCQRPLPQRNRLRKRRRDLASGAG